MSKNQKIVAGICVSRRLKEIIDDRRGYVPRGRYISLILERHLHNTLCENQNCVRNHEQSKLTDLPQHKSDNPSVFPLNDS
ncbi:MAG TPA: hypothetical protein VH500_08195 [Nitrososphaeraceae archaeon]